MDKSTTLAKERSTTNGDRFVADGFQGNLNFLAQPFHALRNQSHHAFPPSTFLDHARSEKSTQT